MSSSPPTSLPNITSVSALKTPPEKPPQIPAGGYFSANSQAAQNPSSIINNKSPSPLSISSTLLQTPPISEAQSRQDRGGYFCKRARSSSKNTNTTSPGNESAPSISPCLSSGSFHSSDTGHSQCSYSSGGYLSPPQFPDDDEKPPYRPRSGSSGSLSMMKEPRRTDPIPNDKKAKVEKRARRRHGCRHKHKESEPHEHSDCEYSGSQLTPTSLRKRNGLCSDHPGHLIPKRILRDNADTFERLLPQSLSGPVPPIVTRRWSSVDVESPQYLQAGVESASSRVATSRAASQDQSVPECPSNRCRSSTFTQGALDQGIVKAVRERLTVRKVATAGQNSQVAPPLSITLRRASGASGDSDNYSRSPSDQIYHLAENSGLLPALVADQHVSQRRQPSTAYLITSEDIESVSLLIAKNLGANIHSSDHNRTHEAQTSTATSFRDTRITTSSIETTKPDASANSAFNASDLQSRDPRPDQGEYLHVDDSDTTLRQCGSDKSVHELLWKGSRKSSGNISSTACETSSESGTSPEVMSEKREIAANKRKEFDPQNARASISEWSWKLPHNDIAMVVTSSDSNSNEATLRGEKAKAKRRPPLRSTASTPKEGTTARVRPFPRFAASHEQLQDVVSFPPLSKRKATNEWISPLPDMEITSPLSSPQIKNPGSLHGTGIDVTTRSTDARVSKPAFTSWIRSAEASPHHSPGIDIRQDYGFGDLGSETKLDDDCRRKSSVKPHPKAAPRTGETSAMGSSIGVHASERRKNSSTRTKRVRTIDNIHKGERDEPASRWRPPSVCPPRLSPSQLSPSQLSPSPIEADEVKEERSEDRVPEMVTRLHRLRSGFTDRISLVEARTPPLPKSDCAGIYGTITGTLRKSIGASCQDDASKHNCDDCAKDPRNPSVDWIG